MTAQLKSRTVQLGVPIYACGVHHITLWGRARRATISLLAGFHWRVVACLVCWIRSDVASLWGWKAPPRSIEVSAAALQYIGVHDTVPGDKLRFFLPYSRCTAADILVSCVNHYIWSFLVDVDCRELRYFVLLGREIRHVSTDARRFTMILGLIW